MITGYLRLIMETGSESCTGRYAFDADSGAHFEPVQNIAEAPIETHIYAEFEGNRLVRWDFHPVAARLAERNKDTALVCVYHGNTEEWARRYVKTHAEQLHHYLYSQNADDRWESIRVTPYILPLTDSDPGTGLQFPWHAYKDKLIPLDEEVPDFDEHIYIHGMGGSRSGVNGLAYVGGTRAWSWGGGIRTVKHEQVHMFGSRHSRGGGEEYGHPRCVMAKSPGGVCGSQAWGLGLIPEEMIDTNPQKKTYFLLPVECDTHDARQGETQAIMPAANRIITARKPSDQSRLGAGPLDAVYIEDCTHRLYPDYKGQLLKGQTATVNGHAIKHLGSKEGVVQLSVDGAPAQEWPKPSAPIPSDMTLNRESLSGVWHNPKELRQGVDISVRDDQVVGYWYTYHPRGEHGVFPNKRTGREWFELDGRIKEGGYISVDVYCYRGKERKKVGHGTMTLLEGNLRFRFWCENYGRDHLDLARFTSEKLEQGIYETGEYEGYSVSQYKVPETPENPEGLLWIAIISHILV